jgi:hypothetical protein
MNLWIAENAAELTSLCRVMVAMSASPAVRNIQSKINPRFLPFIDKVLIAGLKLGAAGKHEAINKVLQLVPEWKRGDCWRRIRQLRRMSALAGHAFPPKEAVQAGGRELDSRQRSLPWSAQDDDRLLNWAGYEPVAKIAQRLGRSVRAVRFRLGALSMSARVTDGWSQRELRKLLRVSPGKLRHLIGSGTLRVRDPRITKDSMLALCTNNGLSLDYSAVEKVTATLSKLDACPWERAADLLGVAVEQLQAFISNGKLKIVDPFVTERCFEEFCRKHGDQINLSLIDAATAKWLAEEYGVSSGSECQISRAQKHALVVRTCKCGRKIAGNIFFKHIKYCPVLQGTR